MARAAREGGDEAAPKETRRARDAATGSDGQVVDRMARHHATTHEYAGGKDPSKAHRVKKGTGSTKVR